MSITYGFFDSVDGDRIYTSDDFANYFKGLIGNGIYQNFLGGLQVVKSSTAGLGIVVKSGKATIDGHWLLNDSDANFTLESGSTISRYDYVVVRLNKTARTMSIEVVSTNDYYSNRESATIKDLVLASIYIRANVTSITQSDITDFRGSSGFVTGLIKQIDTSTLFAQYQAAYEEFKSAYEDWFNKLTSDLIVNTTINEYRNTAHLNYSTYSYDIGIESYVEGDIVDIHKNGVWLIRGKDFTIAGDGKNAQITFTKQISPGDTIDIRVLKSEIGNSVLTDSGDTLYI